MIGKVPPRGFLRGKMIGVGLDYLYPLISIAKNGEPPTPKLARILGVCLNEYGLKGGDDATHTY